MIIHHDPDRYVGVSEHRTCLFHLTHPGKPYAGCTCGGFYSQRPATEQEYRAARTKRLTERVGSLQEELARAQRELRTLRGES